MTQYNLKQLLIKFLKDNNAYEQYIYNFRLNRRKSFDKFIKNNSADSYIDFAFTWDCTKEGWEYWNRLHKQWNMTIQNMCFRKS